MALATLAEGERTPGEVIDPVETMRHLAAQVDQVIAHSTQRLSTPTRAQERAREVATKPMKTPEVKCPLCQDGGYVRADVPLGHPQFGKSLPCKCKEAEVAERRRQRILRASNLDEKKHGELRFATFERRIQPDAYDAARKFIEDEDSHPFLYLEGDPGSGKTHLAVAIAYELIARGEAPVFVVVPDMMDWLRQGFNPKRNRDAGDDAYEARFRDILEAPWLILDDCGAENPTPWAQEKFYQIVNTRYQGGYPTVLTTNLSLIDMDDRVRSRLSDRAVCKQVFMQEVDYRDTEQRGRAPVKRKVVRR